MQEASGRPSSRRASILAAARKVFSTCGFDAGTIRQIAAEAGVAEGLIYHYFDSKEALLDAVIRERSVLAWLEQPEALADGVPVAAALREMATQGLARMQREAEVFLLAWSQLATNPELAGRVGRVVRDITDRVAAYLDGEVARGALRPVDTAAAARIFGGALVFFTIAQSRLSPPLEHLSPGEYVEDLVDILVNGLAAEAGPDKQSQSSTEGSGPDEAE